VAGSGPAVGVADARLSIGPPAVDVAVAPAALTGRDAAGPLPCAVGTTTMTAIQPATAVTAHSPAYVIPQTWSRVRFRTDSMIGCIFLQGRLASGFERPRIDGTRDSGVTGRRVALGTIQRRFR
jgi:hypothetical protein